MLVNIVRWRVLKKDSENQLEVWREIMDYQRSHPEKDFYVRSRFFTFTEKGSSEENWMFIDEYQNREDFDKWMKTAHEDPELMKLADKSFPRWNALIIQGSKKSEFWTEVEKLRVEPHHERARARKQKKR
jgi:hypothetical protein